MRVWGLGDERPDPRLVADVGRLSRPLRSAEDLDPLLERIGDARYVLLGEASHGTHEYYAWRAALSERLVRERGFSFVAVEGDWPDCYRLNRYVRGLTDSGRDAVDVARGFDRWPTWMWANREVAEFVERLRAVNDARPEEERAGFYGLDVYSLWDSLEEVVRYLDARDADAARVARRAWACFEPYDRDEHEYARSTLLAPEACHDEVVELLAETRRHLPSFDGDGAEGAFDAEQNALVIRNAESYYRAMVRGGDESWNVRDRHMVETLERLMRHHGPDARCIVWAHNTHVGDARATDMADAGMVNVGQLVRETHASHDVVVVGFGSHRGTVVAGDAWDAPMENMRVPPARDGSWEDVMHEAGADDKLLLLEDAGSDHAWQEPRGHRAIGVVYHPDRERYGNYVPTVLPARYDAFVHVDASRALSPLRPRRVAVGEIEETFPFGE